MSLPAAQRLLRLLLADVTPQQMRKWEPRDVTSSLWAVAQLGIDTPFISDAVAGGKLWVPRAVIMDLNMQHGHVAS